MTDQQVIEQLVVMQCQYAHIRFGRRGKGANMTNREKKEWLGQYRLAGKEIDRLEEERDIWRSRAEKMTPSFCLVPGGGGTNRIETAAERLEDIQSKLDAAIAVHADLRDAIAAAIGAVEDVRLRYLLERRYIDGMTWEQVAVDMSYGYRQVCRLHGDALDAVKIPSSPKDVLECHTESMLLLS